MRKILSVLLASILLAIRSVAYFVTIAGIAYIAPQLHKAYLNETVGSKVVLVTTENPRKVKTGYSGGTGFYVKAASGKTFIVTNRHVCREASAKKDYMYVSSKGDSVVHKVKIIERYTSADLCLLEPARSDIKGLSLGEMPIIGQRVAAIGHPNLQPKTFTDGEVVGVEQWTIPTGVVGITTKPSDCRYKDNYIWQAPLGLNKKQIEIHDYMNPLNPIGLPIKGILKQATVPVCMAKNLIIITTVLIYHGSSGSPIVDFFGRVVGVMYAVNQDQMWGRGMTIIDLKALLSKY